VILPRVLHFVGTNLCLGKGDGSSGHMAGAVSLDVMVHLSVFTLRGGGRGGG